MHTVELLEEALALAKRMGYEIREEWFGGNGGGACEIWGKKTFFLDLALDPPDQLGQVLDTLRREPDLLTLPMPSALYCLLQTRKSA